MIEIRWLKKGDEMILQYKIVENKWTEAFGWQDVPTVEEKKGEKE